jgi:hypothetical protein
MLLWSLCILTRPPPRLEFSVVERRHGTQREASYPSLVSLPAEEHRNGSCKDHESTGDGTKNDPDFSFLLHDVQLKTSVNVCS